MKEKIRCYSLNELKTMRNCTLDELYDIFKEYNVEVFQPWFSKITSGPTRRPGFYVTTNKNFDNWVKLNNTIAMIKGLKSAKVKYKEYKSDRPFHLFDIQ